MAAARTDVADGEPQAGAGDAQLERVAEVERLAVLERRAVRGTQPRGEELLDRRPVGGVVHVPEAVDVGRAQTPARRGAASRGRAGQVEPCRGAAARGGLAVDREEPLAEALRLQIGSEVDPRHLSVDVPAAVAGQRTVQRRAAEAEVPPHQVVNSTLGVVEERLHDVEHRPAHDPDVLVGRPARVEHVVGRDVLEVPRDRIESQPAVARRCRRGGSAAAR